jgi:hypothetical protein
MWTRRSTVVGEAPVSAGVRARSAGFYAFRAHLIGATTTAPVSTECSHEAVLVAPRIGAGGANVAASAGGAVRAADAPVRIRIPSLAIAAPVAATTIDTGSGLLRLPGNIHRVGWWRDGMAPGARSGAILVAGHVDSAHAGEGVFFGLARIAVGARVELRTRGRRRYVYRVSSVRAYPRRALPLSVYSSRGVPRLVLVTCGGPFNRASGHYRDNIVVTALAAR